MFSYVSLLLSVSVRFLDWSIDWLTGCHWARPVLRVHSCSACTSSSWSCVWCVNDNQCHDAYSTCTAGSVFQSQVIHYGGITVFISYIFYRKQRYDLAPGGEKLPSNTTKHDIFYVRAAKQPAAPATNAYCRIVSNSI